MQALIGYAHLSVRGWQEVNKNYYLKIQSQNILKTRINDGN